MLTLSPYLATYLGIGLFAAHIILTKGGARDFRDAFRTKAGREPGWIACAFAVLAIAALWPVLVAFCALCAVRR